MGVFILFAIGLVIYFIPTFVAHNRQHKQQSSIVILNVFLGWTFVGWVIALIWAVKED